MRPARIRAAIDSFIGIVSPMSSPVIIIACFILVFGIRETALFNIVTIEDDIFNQ